MAHGPDTRELLRRIQECDKELHLMGLNITSLPELPDRIELLDCSFTNLMYLPKLPNRLIYLYIHVTPITVLPELPKRLRRVCCEETPLILQRDVTEHLHVYNFRWRQWEEEEKLSKKRTQYRTKRLKEEIVAKAFHPKRVERWLEEGGWELVNMMFD